MKKLMISLLTVIMCWMAGTVTNADVTREAFVKALLEQGQIHERVYAESFKDVEYEDAVSDYLQAALETGIIEKTDFFRPDEIITKDEAVEMVINTLKYLKRDFDKELFDKYKGQETLSKAEQKVLIDTMLDISKNGKIKTGSEDIDEKINFIVENIDNCENEEIKNVAEKHFQSGFGKVMQSNSQKEYDRGCEEISMAYGAVNHKRSSILTGEYIYDNNGGLIQGHGGNVFFDEKTQKYYWYGEARKTSDPPENLKKYADWGWRIGVACYSSDDLYNWKYESLALEMLESYWGMKFPESDIKVGEVLERPKVIYNKKTDKYVMWMHIDSGNYGYARAGVAVSDSPTGPFEYITSYRPKDKMSRDMTVFQDNDGTAYIYFSTDENASLACSKLSDDYLEPVGEVYYCISRKWREAPAVFRYKDTYYMITSGCTGWDPNAADYATAPSPTGPWTQHGNPCVGEGADKTFLGQSYWVLPLDSEKGYFIFMADIWRPSHHSESGYIWLPIQMQPDGSIRIEWIDEWRIDDIGSVIEMPDEVVSLYGEIIELPKTAKVIKGEEETQKNIIWDDLKTNVPGRHEISGKLEDTQMHVDTELYVVPENIVYFINCGTDTTEDFDIIASDTLNSLSDKAYGTDEKTGKNWGYVTDNEVGSRGDGTMNESVRYDYSEGGEENIGKGITYKMEVRKDKEYSVFVGVGDPWGEEGRYVDILVNGNVVADGHNTENGFEVFLTKNVEGNNGEITVSSVRDEKSAASHLDPLISWIMVVEGDVADIEKPAAEIPEKEAVYEKEIVYRTLKLRDTNLAITYDVEGGLRGEDFKGEDNQKWFFEYTLTGSYVINSHRSSSEEEARCLDVSGASHDAGAWVIDYQKTYGDNQKWFFEKQSDGSYLIKSENSGLYLTYEDGHFTQREKGVPNQTWITQVCNR